MLHETSIYFFTVSSKTIDENHSNENIKLAGMISKKLMILQLLENHTEIRTKEKRSDKKRVS